MSSLEKNHVEVNQIKQTRDDIYQNKFNAKFD